MFSSGAFDCKNCPKTNRTDAPKFCPAWWEMPWTQDGKEFIKQDCSYRILPTMLHVLGKTATLSMSATHEMNNRLDAAETMCNTVSNKMEALAKVIYIAADAAEKRRLENGTPN